jgi:di/tricarboxylate transporter
MTIEMAVVFGLLVVALVVFALDRFPIDLVALSIMGVMLVLGPFLGLSAEEAISGFSNPATITVLAMFILGAGIYRSGAINVLANKAIRFAGEGEVRQLVTIMLIVGPISMFINNTAAVAILIPLVIAMARKHGRAPSKLLMPLSFTSQLAGVVTLIGTSTNILASSLTASAGIGPFSMFEFAPLGLMVFVVGGIYILTAGRWLTPERRADVEVTESYRIKEYLSEVQVLEDSPLVGRSLVTSRLSEQYDVHVLEIRRGDQSVGMLLSDEVIRARDVLVVRARREDLVRIQDTRGLSLAISAERKGQPTRTEDLRLLEVVIGPDSELVGETLVSGNFRNRYNCTVLAMQHLGELVREGMAQVKLRFGDTLLLQGEPAAIEQIKRERGFIVTEQVEMEMFREEKIPVALAIVAGVVVVAALGILPILTTAIVGCVLMVVTGCLRMNELHAAVRLDVIFLLAGVIPLGLALERTGGAELLAGFASSAALDAHPIAVLFIFYGMTMVLTELISNNAAVVVMVPVGLATALSLGIDPKAVVLAIMFAASTSFSTPVGYQTNTMVYGPGGYRFLDFVRVGGPLNLLLALVTPVLIYVFWGL